MLRTSITRESSITQLSTVVERFIEPVAVSDAIMSLIAEKIRSLGGWGEVNVIVRDRKIVEVQSVDKVRLG